VDFDWWDKPLPLSPHSLSPFSPTFPPPLSLNPSLPFPSLLLFSLLPPLRSRAPLNPARRSGAEPQSKSNLVHFSLKIRVVFVGGEGGDFPGHWFYSSLPLVRNLLSQPWKPSFHVSDQNCIALFTNSTKCRLFLLIICSVIQSRNFVRRVKDTTATTCLLTDKQKQVSMFSWNREPP